ncbi:BspA family leucine-rich repeat surface protein [Mycoplasma sp. HU2014]|uniref:BspA family leucine-rich repeat surface protein n=1 Tax=Mycoplasma sp. HU2014 TaxID=1664275 RepID=UPI00067CD2DB|nr:BspA family leucine-rich repeat surface protein [Mycoplasma sp. HU2014]
MSDKSIKIQQFPTTVSKVLSELPKHITNLNNAFDENENEITKGIESWNKENVVDMQQMFFEARKFNQNLSRWNVLKISKSITFNSKTYSG